MAKATKKMVWKSPSTIMSECNGKYGWSGINWSYAIFPTKELMEKFEKECNANGYRTRSDHQITPESNMQLHPQPELQGHWAIQYHHYAD